MLRYRSWKAWTDRMKSMGRLVYHISLILLSAGIAISLPTTLRYVSRKVTALWAFAENEQVFMIMVEIVVAVLIVLLVNRVARSWKDRTFARMAERAGLCLAADARGFFGKKRVKELKERTGFGRDVMVIGSTGYRTFVDPAGDLHQALQNSRQARIMLLDPLKEGAISRAKSIPDPEVSPESFREQIIRSIDFLKGLKAAQKNVRLKLYQDMPLFKLAILGDYACLRHYHTGLHVDDLPEFVFKHDHDPGSLYNPLYQYFLSRWQDPSLPEYDLETDELIYRDRSGNETRRERFNEVPMEFGDTVVERELALTA